LGIDLEIQHFLLGDNFFWIWHGNCGPGAITKPSLRQRNERTRQTFPARTPSIVRAIVVRLYLWDSFQFFIARTFFMMRRNAALSAPESAGFFFDALAMPERS